MAVQRREQLDEALDKLGELTQRWENRLTLDNLALVERYIKAELRILVHLALVPGAGVGRDPQDYCALFERERALRWGDSRGQRHVPAGYGVGGDDGLVRHAHGDQEFVFVCDVETMETPKRVIPSLVRLGPLDEVHRFLGRSVYLFRRTGFKSFGKGGFILENEKAGLSGDGVSLGSHQLANQQVEGGAEVVDGVTDDEGELGGGTIENFGVDDVLGALQVELNPHSARVSFAPASLFGFQAIQVFARPV